MESQAVEKCIICGTPVPDYKPEYCCPGHDCGCMGLPMEPPICSQEYWDELMGKEKGEKS